MLDAAGDVYADMMLAPNQKRGRMRGKKKKGKRPSHSSQSKRSPDKGDKGHYAAVYGQQLMRKSGINFSSAEKGES